MQRLGTLVLVSLFLLIGQGCAAKKQNIALADEFWQQQATQKITLAAFADPEVAFSPRGEIGLLDLAIINSANKALNSALKNFKLSTYHQLNDRFVTELKQRNIPANIVAKIPNEKAAKSLIAQLSDGNLLTIQLVSLGVTREYYSFIPRSYPKVFCILQGRLIDPSNKELWYHSAEITESIEGQWDQPPHYPNIVAALDLALANTTQELLDSFFSGH